MTFDVITEEIINLEIYHEPELIMELAEEEIIEMSIDEQMMTGDDDYMILKNKPSINGKRLIVFPDYLGVLSTFSLGYGSCVGYGRNISFFFAGKSFEHQFNAAVDVNSALIYRAAENIIGADARFGGKEPILVLKNMAERLFLRAKAKFSLCGNIVHFYGNVSRNDFARIFRNYGQNCGFCLVAEHLHHVGIIIRQNDRTFKR